METVEYKNISFTVWDVGGQDKVNVCFLVVEFLVSKICFTVNFYDIRLIFQFTCEKCP